MKVLKLTVLVLVLAHAVQAQVSVNVNIGTPPPWGPAGYTEVRYYYLPDVEAYYDVQSSMFIYFGGGTWIHRSYLPSRYRSYDLYSGYKVVMTDYRGDAPYSNFKEYKSKYARGYRGEAQRTIGERPAKGNSGTKISNKRSHGNREGGRDYEKGSKQGRDQDDKHGNEKQNKSDHDRGDGNNKKK